VIQSIGDVEVPAESTATSDGELKRAALPVPSALPVLPGETGNGGYPACWGHLADGVIVRVGDVEIAGSVHTLTPVG